MNRSRCFRTKLYAKKKLFPKDGVRRVGMITFYDCIGYCPWDYLVMGCNTNRRGRDCIHMTVKHYFILKKSSIYQFTSFCHAKLFTPEPETGVHFSS